MESRVGDTTVHYAEHGGGRPVLVLHGAFVDHREAEACFEPAFEGLEYHRIYPDLPGMGRTPSPPRVRSADDVTGILVDFTQRMVGDEPALLVGHSAGALYARAIAARRPTLGLALICPLLPTVRDVPTVRRVAGSGSLGDDAFRNYFVVQTPAMLDRYERFVAPAAELVDEAALERIGERWQPTPAAEPFTGPTLVVAGRLDSTVGFVAAREFAEESPRATFALLDATGHALPHERPTLLRALLADLLERPDS